MRAHALRDVFDAIFYVLRSSCPWRMLPGDFPPWSTVYYHFRRFRLSDLCHRAFAILREAERKRAGKDPSASAAIVDSQSIKTTKEGAGSNGYDAHNNVKGWKRHYWSTPWACCSRLRHPRRRTGPGRSTHLARRTWTTDALPEEDLGGRCIQRQGARQVV